jgi:hypothetical protein
MVNEALAAYLDAEKRLGRMREDADPEAAAAMVLGACYQRGVLPELPRGGHARGGGRGLRRGYRANPDAKPIAKRRVKARVANDHRSPVMASFFSPENYTADV